MHLEDKAAQIVDLFARLGGCWSTLSTPPRYGPELVLILTTAHETLHVQYMYTYL